MLQTIIKRDPKAKIFSVFNLYLNGGKRLVMSGKRRKKLHSNYEITINTPVASPADLVGQVHSNLIGTEYHVFNEGLNPNSTKDEPMIRQELAVVTYQSNIFGQLGPRIMKILMPEIIDESMHVWKPHLPREGMLCRFR